MNPTSEAKGAEAPTQRIHEDKVWRKIIVHAGNEGMDCIKKTFADENVLPLLPKQEEIVEAAARLAASIAVRTMALIHPGRDEFLDRVAADTRRACETGDLGWEKEIKIEP